ncbi:MAG: GNAT family N-acetyltransferase [bacterium]|nr:GNAT family N-acetyltransferase [bacterium]
MFKGIIRELRKEDIDQVQQIFEMYWTDDEFLEKLKNRLKQVVEDSPEIKEQSFKYFVAEESGEIVGIAAMRTPPEKMKKYATTDNPVEFYVLASKYEGRGIGTALRNKRLEEAKRLGYTEVLFYSPESHKESWKFHDSSGGERIYPVSIDDEPGCIWRIKI